VGNCARNAKKLILSRTTTYAEQHDVRNCSRWWEMAALSLLSTTEGLAVVKDVLKYLPLRNDIARDCLAARPFETLINLQRGLGAERSKIPNDTHELSPRSSRELALDLSEKTCSAIRKPTSSQHIEWNLDRRPPNKNVIDRFAQVPFSHWIWKALGCRTGLFKELYAWTRDFNERGLSFQESEDFTHPLTNWIIYHPTSDPSGVLVFVDAIRSIFNPSKSINDVLVRWRVLGFRLKAFVRYPDLVEWEQMEAFDLFFFYRSVPTMGNIQGLANKLTNEDLQRFRLLSFANVEDKSLIFRELCNPWLSTPQQRQRMPPAYAQVLVNTGHLAACKSHVPVYAQVQSIS